MSAETLEQYVPQQRYFEFQYLNMLLHLLPMGAIWGAALNKLSTYIFQDSSNSQYKYQDTLSASPDFQYQDNVTVNASDTLYGCLFGAFAAELERLEWKICDLFRQQVPGTATDMLEDWERVLELPEANTTQPSTLEERQDIAFAKLYTDYNMGLNSRFYIDYAAKLGFVMTVTENADQQKPFYVAPVGTDPYNIGSRMNDRLNDSYQVGNVIFTIISGPTDHMQLKAIMENLKPAHVIITWVE